MELSFASRKLEKQFADEAQIRRLYGERARPLMRRLDLLRAAACLADVPHTPPTRRHALGGKWAGHVAVDITANWRLIFRPVPFEAAGDFASVTAIEIVAVEDYH